MSLPTYAVFFDSDGNELGRQFVNVGWWVDADNFSDAVCGLAKINSAEYIELYDILIPTNILPQYDKPNWKECKEKLESDMDTYVSEFNVNNESIRNIVKQYYLDFKDNPK